MTDHTETVTVLPPDLYDELMADDTEPQPNENLRRAAERARKIVIKK